MTHPLTAVGPEFVTMAHRIVWCVAATVDRRGRPRTRILHPIWEWDGTELTGWVATSPLSPKATDLRGTPAMSVTYWAPSHDTCTADCRAVWEDSDEQRRAGWERFAQAPAPVGYVPSVVPAWTSPDAVLAENALRAVQAACSYSCSAPPRRSCRWMVRWASR